MRKTASLLLALAFCSTAAYAQQEERFDARQSGIDQPTQILGTAIAADLIFAGTSLNGPGGNNDVFLVNPATNTSSSLLAGVPVWGATFDVANQRILYTTEGGANSAVDGAPLFEIPLATGMPALLGVIRDGTGADFRIDGLALSGGTLFGSRAAGSVDGIYSIDLGTLVATLEFPFTDSISGIDADPDTGIIYGVDDTITSLVAIDVAGNTITPVTAYPDVANEPDIDGLAVGGGRAYLVPDDNAPGLIYVYDIASNTFLTPISAPWGVAADTFSGAAYTTSAAIVLPDPVEVPIFNSVWASIMGLALLLVSFRFISRRRVR